MKLQHKLYKHMLSTIYLVILKFNYEYKNNIILLLVLLNCSISIWYITVRAGSIIYIV